MCAKAFTHAYAMKHIEITSVLNPTSARKEFTSQIFSAVPEMSYMGLMVYLEASKHSCERIFLTTFHYSSRRNNYYFKFILAYLVIRWWSCLASR